MEYSPPQPPSQSRPRGRGSQGISASMSTAAVVEGQRGTPSSSLQLQHRTPPPASQTQVNSFQLEESSEATTASLHNEDYHVGEPEEADVLFGRGRCRKHHPGNKLMHELVNRNRREYQILDRDEKTDLTWVVLRKIQETGGRFLRKQDGKWFVVEDEVARQKVSHLMRDRRLARAMGIDMGEESNSIQQDAHKRADGSSTKAYDDAQRNSVRDEPSKRKKPPLSATKVSKQKRQRSTEGRELVTEEAASSSHPVSVANFRHAGVLPDRVLANSSGQVPLVGLHPLSGVSIGGSASTLPPSFLSNPDPSRALPLDARLRLLSNNTLPPGPANSLVFAAAQQLGNSPLVTTQPALFPPAFLASSAVANVPLLRLLGGSSFPGQQGLGTNGASLGVLLALQQRQEQQQQTLRDRLSQSEQAVQIMNLEAELRRQRRLGSSALARALPSQPAAPPERGQSRHLNEASRRNVRK